MGLLGFEVGVSLLLQVAGDMLREAASGGDDLLLAIDLEREGHDRVEIGALFCKRATPVCVIRRMAVGVVGHFRAPPIAG